MPCRVDRIRVAKKLASGTYERLQTCCPRASLLLHDPSQPRFFAFLNEGASAGEFAAGIAAL